MNSSAQSSTLPTFLHPSYGNEAQPRREDGTRRHLSGTQKPHSTQRLELNYYLPGTKYHENFKSGSEMDHLAFWVKDIESEHKQLLKKGAKKAIEPFAQGKYRFAFLKDPDGIWIELIGRAKRQS